MSNDEITSNFEKFVKILLKVKDREPQLDAFLNKYSDVIASAPGHDRSERSSAIPGGMVARCLSVLGNARQISTTGVFNDSNLSMDSIIITCLLHDIGRIGDDRGAYYVEQTSQWHREKGINYTYNPNIRRMSYTHRGLYLLQREGVQLTQDEWIAILTHAGSAYDENRFYIGYEPPLAVLLQTSIKLAHMCDFQGPENR